VIANSEPLHLAAYQEVFESLGVGLTRDDYYENYLGYDDRGVFQKLAASQGWTLDDTRLQALIREKGRAYEAAIDRTDVLYPAAAACIAGLAAAFPLGIASGALRHEIEWILKRARLDRHFGFIVAAGDTRQSKPWPDPYIKAAELHDVPPAACLAIEDSRWGIESAKAAGLQCVGITTTYPASELTTADRVIDSLEQFNLSLIQSIAR
jgi:beta-phosphoglucomutase